MARSSECPECGKTLPIDAPQGLCPPCLLYQGLASDDPESIDGPAGFLSSDLANFQNGSAVDQRLNCLATLRDTEPGCHSSASSLANRSGPTGAASRYQLFGEIARGGMGAIWRGRDPELGRELAVKVLLEQHRNDPTLVRRFIEEARIGGQLQHPGIVPVHELGTFPDARPYFTMKLVTGRTLAELLAARAQIDEDRPRFLGIFEQICQTMSYAHARGVIHRDLKPGNVMVGSFGEVQLMDWGLAKVLRTGKCGRSNRCRIVRGRRPGRRWRLRFRRRLSVRLVCLALPLTWRLSRLVARPTCSTSESMFLAWARSSAKFSPVNRRMWVGRLAKFASWRPAPI